MMIIIIIKIKRPNGEALEASPPAEGRPARGGAGGGQRPPAQHYSIIIIIIIIIIINRIITGFGFGGSVIMLPGGASRGPS